MANRIAGITVEIGGGLRRSEALALTIFDFNLGDHTVTVNKAHEFTQNTPRQKGPKTDHGYRPFQLNISPIFWATRNRW